METIIQDVLDILRELSLTTPSLLLTPAEALYFADTFTPSAPVVKSSPPLQPVSPPLSSAPTLPTFSRTASPVPPRGNSSKTTSSSHKLPPRTPPHASSFKKPASFSTPLRPPLQEMRSAVQKLFPSWSLRDAALDDTLAQKKSRLWADSSLTTPIVVIAWGEVGAGLQFLKHLTQAIDRLIAPAQLVEGVQVEQEKGWELLLTSPALKRVVSSPFAMWKHLSLAQHYHQNGATHEKFLGKCPLFLLEQSLLYLKYPERKRELWKNLSTQLSL